MTSNTVEAAVGLVRPAVTTEQASKLVRSHYGIKGDGHELGSNQDRNFVITTVKGEKWVLRVDNEVFEQSARDAQHEAIEAYQAHGVRVPSIQPGKDARLTQHADGHAFRLFEFMAGPSLVDEGYLAPIVRREMGVLAARSVTALKAVKHPGMNREHQWDMRAAHAVTTVLLPSITDKTLKTRVASASAQAEEVLQSVAPHLAVQAIHGDLTDDNVACERGDDSRLHPYAVLDFGDLALGWRVAEIAVTCASLLHHDPTRPLGVLDAVKAYHEVSPLTVFEARALWPLIVQRAAVLIASGWHQLAIDGANAYAKERIAGEQRIFDAAVSLPLIEGIEAVMQAVGHGVPLHDFTGAKPAELVTGLHQAATLDLGVESAQLNGGVWLSDTAEQELVAVALATSPVIVIPYGQYRLTKALPNQADAAKTFALLTEIVIAGSKKPTPVFAPVTATVIAQTPTTVEFATEQGVLTLSGIVPSVTAGERVKRGAQIGTVKASPSRAGQLRVQLRRNDVNVPVPLMVEPERVAAWQALCPDPAALLGLAAVAQADESVAELARRNEVFASAQERYFEHPPQIERGWKHYLVDTTGRVYVDMVNNVTGLGHGHVGVANAMNDQVRVLNTNSRFLYRQLAEYSERLLELAPKGGDFDTVLLVNSGSEAVDLAIRLAQAATQKRTVVALREAYHGWTMASDAVTTSAFDNPYAMQSRPDWVHVADIPNRYRGTHTGDDCAPKYVADLTKQLDQLNAPVKGANTDPRHGVAAFISETVLGNAGGVLLPDGYLKGVYEAVRAQGGLCIADEVQVGFGRMGDTFWGVELSGAVPDIITIAKPMGNGYPIGGVMTSKKIADALSTEGNFFSSAGGSPVSCAVGLAVLDAMRAEGLQENARVVGNHLKKRLNVLAKKHDMIGSIHGHGLYLGVELVRDRATLEPAAAEASAISERLRELGVVVMTTSERMNVLKVKPPLCLTQESADFFVDALDEVLATGW
jgi:4-aminobutyrate aminotransferase-like enzyme/Ser/Thr protein kinase RdoA (MazF antagonist)